MRKYPFTPEVLEALPEGLAALYRSLEDKLLELICTRLDIQGQFKQVTLEEIRALRSHGIPLADIEAAILEVTGMGEKELEAVIQQVVEHNQVYYSELIDLAGLTEPGRLVSERDVESLVRQTKREMRNITGSFGFLVDGGRTRLPPANAYQWALDNATMQMTSGAVPYNQAIKSAVIQLADSGLRVVDYESGHRDHLDVAVKRAVRTGVSQLCGQYTDQAAERLGSHYYEVSAHSGARDKAGKSPWSSHKDWQGKVYSTRSWDKYPNIYRVCGLGQVDGLEGANCNHRRHVWVEGVSERQYSDKELREIDPAPFEFEGEQYTHYEATQKQRQIERTVRHLRRRETALRAAGMAEDAADTTARIRRLRAYYREFSKAAKLRTQNERMQIIYPD